MIETRSILEAWTDSAAWESFVEASPQGSVFCRPAMLDALGLPWEIVRIGSEDGTIAAVLVTAPDGSARRAPEAFTQYHGILLDGRLATAPAHRRTRLVVDGVTALLEALQQRGSLSWCLHPTFPDLRALSWFNYHAPERGRFTIEMRYTGELALDPRGAIDGLLASVRAVRRQEYRKARERFTVIGSTDLDLLDSLHAATFARQGLDRPAHDGARLRAIAAAALRGGFGELLVAFDRTGDPAGATLFLFDHRAGYYLVAANHPAYRSTGVSTLLFMAGVERALARRASIVDVVGMNSPGRADFKASFGAVPRPYAVVDWRRP